MLRVGNHGLVHYVLDGRLQDARRVVLGNRAVIACFLCHRLLRSFPLTFGQFKIIRLVEVGVLNDVIAARLDFVAHQDGNAAVSQRCVLNRHLHQFALRRIHRRRPELFGVHFAQAFVALERIAFACFLDALRQLLVVVGIENLAALLNLVQRRHSDINVTAGDKLFHVTEEESEQNGADVRAVLIGIGEDDDFVVFEVGEVEILVDGRAERGNQRAELLVAQHLIQPLLFGIEGLAAPFIFSESPNLTITDAFFESFSGLTTTGATTLVGLDSLPHAILFYRQMLQWFGGMGIIVLAVAILPILGVGGMQLYRAEMPGPLKDNKMRPRIAETAKTLWLIYVLLTVACALALWFAGMDAFDAIGHSFATIAAWEHT